MKKISAWMVAAIGLLALAGCNDTQRARSWAYNKTYHITLYSASGSIIQQWDSKDNVASESNSDGWHFLDARSHKLIMVTGTLVAEEK